MKYRLEEMGRKRIPAEKRRGNSTRILCRFDRQRRAPARARHASL